MTENWQTPDLDEVRPDLFVLNNAKVRPFLRGEGELSGKMFRFISTRREGWVGRIRMAGFNVRTLQDRIESLARITPGVLPGPEFDRLLASARERIATWDAARMRWRELPVQTDEKQRTVRLRLNEVIRRRKSRGEGEYFVTIGVPPDRTNLRPIGATNALLHAYSMAAALGQSPRVTPRPVEGGYFVPSSLGQLPVPHHKALDYLSLPDVNPWTFAPAQIPQVEEVFSRLGLPFDRVE